MASVGYLGLILSYYKEEVIYVGGREVTTGTMEEFLIEEAPQVFELMTEEPLEPSDIQLKLRL